MLPSERFARMSYLRQENSVVEIRTEKENKQKKKKPRTWHTREVCRILYNT